MVRDCCKNHGVHGMLFTHQDYNAIHLLPLCDMLITSGTAFNQANAHVIKMKCYCYQMFP